MNIHISATALLLGVAKADEAIDKNEINAIQNIIIELNRYHNLDLLYILVYQDISP